jgi:hypothetical protein
MAKRTEEEEIVPTYVPRDMPVDVYLDREIGLRRIRARKHQAVMNEMNADADDAHRGPPPYVGKVRADKRAVANVDRLARERPLKPPTRKEAA